MTAARLEPATGRIVTAEMLDGVPRSYAAT